MKPDWDKLSEEFKDSKTALVVDVDCTTDGKSLCEVAGVKSFPTIKHGDPNNLEDYKGGRDFDSLKKFADANLGPRCSPASLDLCDSEKKAVLENFMKMSPSDLEAGIKEKADAMAKVEADHKSFIDNLQKSYVEGGEKKDKDIEDIHKSGLRLMKAVATKRGLTIKSSRQDWVGLALAVVGMFVVAGILGGVVMYMCFGEGSVQHKKVEKVENKETVEKAEKND